MIHKKDSQLSDKLQKPQNFFPTDIFLLVKELVHWVFGRYVCESHCAIGTYHIASSYGPGVYFFSVMFKWANK